MAKSRKTNWLPWVIVGGALIYISTKVYNFSSLLNLQFMAIGIDKVTAGGMPMKPYIDFNIIFNVTNPNTINANITQAMLNISTPALGNLGQATLGKAITIPANSRADVGIPFRVYLLNFGIKAIFDIPKIIADPMGYLKSLGYLKVEGTITAENIRIPINQQVNLV